MAIKADCSGWATKANMLCSDGRTILQNAFSECDGKTVPVVWNHEHNDPNAVLGHALLENRGDGVYAYITFNDTDAGQNAKKLVQHKDVDRLSIYANKLIQRGGDVIHGIIREVSLVLELILELLLIQLLHMEKTQKSKDTSCPGNTSRILIHYHILMIQKIKKTT